MSTETPLSPAPISPAPSVARLAAPRPRLKALARQAMQTADQASKLLPKIVARIEERIDSMEDKQLVSAGHLLAGLSQQRAHVSKLAGLKNGERSEQPSTIVNVAINAGLPIEERIKLIQAEVSGVPRIEAQAQRILDVVKTPQIDATPRPEPELVSVPQNAAAFSTRSEMPPGRSFEDRLKDLGRF